MKAMNGIIRYGCEPKPVFATWNDKFPQEKVCFENEDYLIHFDGILLNSAQLKAELDCSSNQEILLKLYQAHGAELVFHAKGLYCLVLWDKQAQKVLITNDLLSKRSVYYASGEDAMCYGSSYHDLLDLMSREGFTSGIDVDAVREMVRQGFVNFSRTYLKDVHYLNAFESLVVDLSARSMQLVHHPMPAVDIPTDEEAMIDQFQARFSRAVALAYQKNAAYGYTQYASLSGGMDSRSSLLTANKLGYRKDIVCFTYSQSGSLDYDISRTIAADLGLDYIFYPMDAAVFVGRLNEALSLNECMQSGIGATGARTVATVLNTSNAGLVHIGICGGELMGDLVQRNRGKEPENKVLRTAVRVCKKLREELTKPEPQPEGYRFDVQEYLCHLRASQNFSHMFIDKCECLSPFMDEDVVMYVLQLNPGLKYNRRIYRKWMRKYLPNRYPITSTCAPIDSNMLQEQLASLKYKVLRRHNGVSQWDMVPVTHWIEANPGHAENCTREYEEGCRWLAGIDGSETLLGIVQAGWDNIWIKRLYVLTALQAMKDVYSRFGRLI